MFQYVVSNSYAQFSHEIQVECKTQTIGNIKSALTGSILILYAFLMWSHNCLERWNSVVPYFFLLTATFSAKVANGSGKKGVITPNKTCIKKCCLNLATGQKAKVQSCKSDSIRFSTPPTTHTSHTQQTHSHGVSIRMVHLYCTRTQTQNE